MKHLEDLKRQLDPASHVPLYSQIQKGLEELIQARVLESGDKLPGDMAMSAMLGVSPWTVRKAFAGLVEKGLVRRAGKIGTLVTDKAHPLAMNIGYFYPAEAEPLMGPRGEYIQRWLTPHHADIKIIAHEPGFYDHTDLNDLIARKDLRGAIFMTQNSPGCLAQLQGLEKRRFPHVRMGNKYFTGQLASPLVTGDDRGALRQGFDYLWSLGHRRIGMISAWIGRESDREYLQCCKERGAFEPRWLMSINFFGPFSAWQRMPGPQMARGYLDENRDLTAVLVEYPGMGADVVKQAQALGRRVPEDLSVLSQTDWEALVVVTPSVSALHLSSKAEGERAAELLLDVLRNGPAEKERVIRMPFSLIHRGSTAPPASPAM